MQRIIRHETYGHSPPSLLLDFAHFSHILAMCAWKISYILPMVCHLFGTSDADWLGHFLDYLSENDS